MSAREFWAVARTRRMVTLLVLLTAAAVACGLLGSWQLDRAELRGAKAAQEAREAILGAPPVPVGELLAPGTTFRGELVGRRVEAEGEFTGEQLLVAGRAQDGHVGFLVLAELRVLDDGAGASFASAAEAPVLAVVRGWVPEASTELPALPVARTSVTGHLQVGEAAGTGRLADGTVLPEGQTDAISMAQLAAAWGTPIYTGYLVQTEPAAVAPLVQLDPPALPGSGLAWRNLMYAIQWWIFGGFALAIWVRSVRDEARDQASLEASEPGLAGPDPTEQGPSGQHPIDRDPIDEDPA